MTWPAGPAWARARRHAHPRSGELLAAVDALAIPDDVRTVAVIVAASSLELHEAAPLLDAVHQWRGGLDGLAAHLWDELPMFTYLKELASVQAQFVAQRLAESGITALSSVGCAEPADLAARMLTTPLLGETRPDAVVVVGWRGGVPFAELVRATEGTTRDVFVAGSAAKTCLGDLDHTWQAILAGRSGVRPGRPTLFAGLPCAPAEATVAGECPWDRTVTMARDAVRAVATPGRRMAVVYAPMDPGPGGSDAHAWQANLLDGGRREPLLLELLQNDGLDVVSVLVIEATCAGGVRALAEAARLVASGEVDDAVAVASVARNNPYHLSQFAQLTALSRFGGDPRFASRPFAPDRAGMVMAEAAAAIAVTSRPTDVAVRGIALALDPSQPTAPSADHVANVMRVARPGDAVSAHGTGTAANDDTEASVMRALDFGAPVFAAKAMTGHASSASGLVEVALACRALADGLIPPTPHADTDGVATVDAPTAWSGDGIVKNSFGFGGQYASVRLAATPR